MERIKPKHWRWGVALAAVFVPAIATGALTLPHVFTPGTPIRASEVNANFEAVRQKSDSIEAGLGTVQTGLSTLQGQVATLTPLSAQVTTLLGQVATLQTRVTTLEAGLATKLTVDQFSVALEADQAITGTLSNNIYVATPSPARLSASVTGAVYLLSWYAEFGRSANGGGNRVLARLRDVTLNTSLGLTRLSQGLENTATTALPADTAFATAGDVVAFSGAVTLTVTPGQTRVFELQYAINNNANTGAVIRVQRQRLDLIRIR